MKEVNFQPLPLHNESNNNIIIEKRNSNNLFQDDNLNEYLLNSNRNTYIKNEELEIKKIKNNLEEDTNSETEENTFEPNFIQISTIQDIMNLENPCYRISTNNEIALRNNSIRKNSIRNSMEEKIIKTHIKRNSYLNFRESKKSLTRKSDVTYKSNESEFFSPFELEIFDSMIMTLLQIMNCIIKTSLVQMAYCMKVLGIIYGVLGIILVSIISLISLDLLLIVHKISKENSYLTFSEKTFGIFGKFIILFLNFLSCFGSCMTFIIIFLKVIPGILSINIGYDINYELLFSFIIGIILFIYCFKQDVSGIKTAGHYAFLGVILFFFITIYDFLTKIYSGDIIVEQKTIKLNDLLWGISYSFHEKLTAISCIILSFSYHIYTFSIYGYISDFSIIQFWSTATFTVIISAFIYIICGICGCLLYYHYLTDSILDAIGNDLTHNLLSLAFCLNLIMTFPITFAALKNYFCFLIEVFLTIGRDFLLYFLSCFQCAQDKIVFIKKKEKNIIDKRRFFSNTSSVVLNKPFEIFFVVILFLCVFIVSHYFNELKFIFAILGGIMANLFSYIFPALFYLVYTKSYYHINTIVSIIIIILGIFTLFETILANILS